ncbi:MAG TPA: protein-disulfide reductase DsbD domain-containing protein [Candidatus Acidoferrales bacterium]|nr:protein-disulfide reductase DsbD domain-containing protein [Candidatus Acidoferrales bacterium]
MKASYKLGILCAVVALGASGLLVALATARNLRAQALPNASSIVKPHTVVSLDPVPRGKEFQAAVMVDIARGFHMNSHKPTDEYLIPTTLTPQLPPGFELNETIYPNGRLEKFSFSPNKPLDVYTGSVTLKLRLTAEGKAPLGAVTIPVTLRYQACNDAACLPPVKVPVNVEVHIAAANAKANPLHPEVFSSTMAAKSAR